MKKIIVAVLLAGCSTSVFSQGLVNFLNNSTTLISACGSTPLPAVAGQYYFGLFIAPPGTTDPTAFTFTGVYATNQAFAGRFSGGANRVVPGWRAGEEMSYLIHGWLASDGHEWEGGSIGCLGGSGSSAIGTGRAGGFDGIATLPSLILFGTLTINTGFSMSGRGQGPDTPAFQNLDFEAAECFSGGQSVTFSSAFPFWQGYLNSTLLDSALYNGTTISSPCISLLDAGFSGAFGSYDAVRQGRVYALLKAGWGPTSATASIAQSGVVPVGARSLRLNVAMDFPEVTFNGAQIPLRALNYNGRFWVLGGDISPYAGQSGELRFTAPFVWMEQYPMQHASEVYMDYIRFSTLPPVAWPTVLTQPLSRTVEIGERARFAVRASGDLPLVYCWIFNGTNTLSVATNAVLDFAVVDASQSGAYTVVVTNAGGVVTSSPGLLSVIPRVERRLVPALALQGSPQGQPPPPLHLEYSERVAPTQTWVNLATVVLTTNWQLYFDLTSPLPSQRFYRTWQERLGEPDPGVSVAMVPALTLNGSLGDLVRVDYINAVGPTDAWVTLSTVQLTNTSQLYFDTSAGGQPPRLYRLVPTPQPE